MSVEQEVRAVRYVVEMLMRMAQSKRENTVIPYRTALEAHTKFDPVHTNDLKRFFYGKGSFDKKAVYLWSLRDPKDSPVLLWCKWDITNAKCNIWFQIGIWLKEGEFVGFRFEMPEEGDNHNYFHVQPSQNLGYKDTKILKPINVPTRNPTVPLTANSALDLLLCLVVSLYGMKGLTELRESASDIKKIRQNSVFVEAMKKMFSLQVRNSDHKIDF